MAIGRAPCCAGAATAQVGLLSSKPGSAHHEALFGPQSSLAVESEGFVSLHAHEHVFGVGSTYDQETAYIVSGGVTPFREVPWSLTLVQTYTYENGRAPQGDQTGPLSSCGGCVARENLLAEEPFELPMPPHEALRPRAIALAKILRILTVLFPPRPLACKRRARRAF